MTLETGTITEIHSGIFSVILWAPDTPLFASLLDPEFPYVLSWQHQTGRYAWEAFQLPLTNPTIAHTVFSRSASFDYVVPTAEFITLAPDLRPSLRAVQLHTMPPDHLNLSRIEGQQRYRILNECGWHLLIDTPANDYGQLVSPDRTILERAIQLHGGG